MQNLDIRWQQRFSNYTKALAELTEAVNLSRQRNLSKLEKQGLIQGFEYTHELAWKTLKDFLEERGTSQMYGSRDVTREAFAIGIIGNGEVWMDMIKSLNKTSHTYDEDSAQEIVDLIIRDYFAEFIDLDKKLSGLK